MKTISIKSTIANDYKLVTATGAVGGLTNKGDIYIDLFVEKPKFTNEVIIETDDTGKILREQSMQDVEIVRELQMGLLLKADVAEALASVLQQLNEARKSSMLGGNVAVVDTK